MPPPAEDRALDRARGAGSGTLVVATDGARSTVRTSIARSPLKLLAPRNHGHAAWVYTSSFGGGILDGDDIHLDVVVAPGASAFVTSQASTKIYRSPSGCRQTIDARVGAGALLAFVPDPVVCFAAARFEQQLTLRLDESASLVLVDALQAGRTAHGERWAFSRYRSRIDLYAGASPLVGEAVLLDARHGDVARRMGAFDAMATIVLSGPRLAEARPAIHARITETPLTRNPDLLESASLVGDATLIVRVAGNSAERVLASLRRHLDFLPSLLGDDPFARKW